MPRCLIIEDNEEIAFLGANAMRMKGYETECIYNGAKALLRLAESESVPDIVVLDLQIPSINGVQILEYIRNDDNLKKVPVIILTANAYMASSVEDKADCVLLKPVSFLEMSDIADRIVGQRKVDDPKLPE